MGLELLFVDSLREQLQALYNYNCYVSSSFMKFMGQNYKSILIVHINMIQNIYMKLNICVNLFVTVPFHHNVIIMNYYYKSDDNTIRYRRIQHFNLSRTRNLMLLFYFYLIFSNITNGKFKVICTAIVV